MQERRAAEAATARAQAQALALAAAREREVAEGALAETAAARAAAEARAAALAHEREQAEAAAAAAAAERARNEQEAARIAGERSASEALAREQAAGGRRRAWLRRAWAGLRRLAAPSALLLAFALGLLAHSLWLQPAGPEGEASVGRQVQLQPDSGTGRPKSAGVLWLKLDADAAGFAARAANARRKAN